MVILLSTAKVIVTPHDVMVKFLNQSVVLQAKTDDLVLFAGAHLMVAHCGTTKWSISLESIEHLESVSRETGIAIHA